MDQLEHFEAGCYAWVKMQGWPWWPGVLYNSVDEVPPEFYVDRGKGPPKPLKPGGETVLVYFLESYNFGEVHKSCVKAVDEVDPEVALRACKHKKAVHRMLKKAIATLQEECGQGDNVAVVVEEDEEADGSKAPPEESDHAPQPPAAGAKGKRRGGATRGRGAKRAKKSDGGHAKLAAHRGSRPPEQEEEREHAADGEEMGQGRSAGRGRRKRGGRVGGGVEVRKNGNAVDGAQDGSKRRRWGDRSDSVGGVSAARGKRGRSGRHAGDSGPFTQGEDEEDSEATEDEDIGVGSGSVVKAATLTGLTLAGLLKDGFIHEEARILLPQPKGVSSESAAEEATIASDGRIHIGGATYDDLETLLEERLGITLSKRERSAWSRVRYLKGSEVVAETAPTLAEHVQRALAQQSRPADSGRELKKNGGKKSGPGYASASESMSCVPQGLSQPGASLTSMDVDGEVMLAQHPEQDATGKKSSATLKRQAADGPDRVGFSGREDDAEAGPMRQPGGAASVSRSAEGEAAGNDDYQENMFLAFWKTVDPGRFAQCMDGYAVWDAQSFDSFETCNGDEEEIEDAEVGGRGPGGSGRLRKASQRKTIRASDRISELMANKLPPHTQLTCEKYGVAGGSSSRHYSVNQPCTVKIHPDVPFLCDLHAHLSEAEIIGFIAGRYDREQNCLLLQAPFPCRATPRADGGATDVEMDPGSEVEVRSVIDRLKMTVTGWYHSHPSFIAEPSLIDMENQRQYQMLFMDEATSLEPFLGMIVATYDESLKTPTSMIRYFHVRSIKMTPRESVRIPMRLEVKLAKSKAAAKRSSSDVIPTDGGSCATSAADGVIVTLPVPPASSTPAVAPPAGPSLALSPVQAPPAANDEIPAAAAAPDSRATAAPAPPATQEDPLDVVMVDVKADALSVSQPVTTHGIMPAPPDAAAAVEVSVVSDDAAASGPPIKNESPLVPAPPPINATSHQVAAPADATAPPAGSADVNAARGASSAQSVAISTEAVAAADSQRHNRLPESVFRAIQDGRHRQLPPSDQLWQEIEGRFLSDSSKLGLRCTLETVKLLAAHYSRSPTRVEFTAEWRKGVSKGEKFESSLRRRVENMSLGGPADKKAFLTAVIELIAACWAENASVARPPPPGSNRVRRGAA